MNLEKIEIERKKINDEIQELRNKGYKIEIEYLKLTQEKCRENIGRCFKKIYKRKVVAYCKIIDIDKLEYPMHGIPLFNKYQYPAIWIKYPYNNEIPIYEDNIFSGNWEKKCNYIIDDLNGTNYVEISKEKFFEKFKEINQLWLEKIGEI